MPKIVRFPYTPGDKQQLFHQTQDFITLFGGAVGGGKTAAIAADAISVALQYNCNIYMGRADFTDFRNTTMLEVEKFLPEGTIASWNHSLNRIIFKPNPHAINAKDRIIDGELYPGRTIPSSIFMVPLANPEKIKSATLGAFYMDELSGIPEEVMFMAISRMREPSMHYSELKIKAGSNPVANWVKRWFITMPNTREDVGCTLQPDPYMLAKDEHCGVSCQFGGCKEGRGVSFIPSFIKDNKFLPRNYEARMRAVYPKELADMLIEGSWELLGGAVFPEVATLPYTTPHPIPADWPRYMAIDPHTRTPTHVLWVTVSPSNQIFVYRELVMSDSIPNICANIKRHEIGEQVMFRIIDTSANSDDVLTGLNVMDEFSKHGITCIGAAKGNFIGYSRIKEALQKNRIQVFKNCPVFKDQWQNLKWEEYASKTTSLRKEEIQNWVKKDDHLFDCFKYIMIANPRYVLPSAWTTAQSLFQMELQKACEYYHVDTQ